MNRRGKYARVPLLVAVLLLLTLIPFVLFRGSQVPEAEAAWWDNSWRYRKPIQVANNTTQQNNVYVSLTLDTSDTTKFQDDCGDLRFTKQNGQVLSYYIASGCGTASTSVHVQLDIFPAGAQTFYAYYGNPSAPDCFTNNDFLMEATNYSVGGTGSEETAPGPVAYWKFDEGSGAIAYDSAGHSPGQEVLIDGDMENEGTSVWMASTGDYESLLSKETANPHSGNQVLRITSVNDEVSWAYQQVLQSAMRYRITGYARSDGSAHPTLTTNGSSAVFWTGTTSTEWQYFDEIFEAQTNRIWLRKTRGGAGSYVDFDQVSVVPISDGNHGTISGATWANEDQCVSGKCLSFDGVADYVDTNPLLLKNNNTFTLGAWVRTNSASTMRIIHKGFYAGADGNGFHFRMESNGRLVYNAGSALTSTSTINDNRWHYVTAVMTGSQVSLYIDGQQEGSKTYTSIISSSNNLQISGYNSGTGEVWQGLIDEVKIFPYALTEDQIKTEYNLGAATIMGTGPTVAPPAGGTLSDSLVAHWAFDEQAGQTVHDRVGGYNGTFGATLEEEIYDPTWQTSEECQINGCLSFDGNNDYVPTNSQVPIGQVFSYSAWIKPFTCSSTHAILNGSSNTWNAFQLEGATLFLRLYQPLIPGDAIFTGPTLNCGEWSHVAVTYESGDSTTFYLNGEQSNTQSAADTVVGGGIRSIGGKTQYTPNGGSGFHGLIDEVKIYNTALTADQIKQDMNAGASLTVGMGANEADELIDGAGAPPIAEWKFDEKQGTVAYDSSGNANDGTVNGATWRSGCQQGACLEFDGNNRISISNDPILSPNQVTVGVWARLSPSFNSWGYLVSKEYGFSGYALYVAADRRPVFITNDASSPQNFNYGSTNLEKGKWYYLVGTYDGTKSTIYVDGVSENVQSFDMVQSSSTLFLGNHGDNTRGFNGQIDHVRIYDYARTPAQIAYDYNRGKPVAHWKFDECEGTVAHDSSGNDNHGAINIGASGSQTTVGTCQTAGAWANGKDGKFSGSLNFDGTDDYVELDTALLSFERTSPFSIGLWMKPAALTTNVIFSKQLATSPYTGYALWLLSNGRVKLEMFNLTGTTMHSSAGTLVTDEWQHILITYDGSSSSAGIQIYINGTPESMSGSGSISGSIINSVAPQIMGREGPNRVSSGQIDDVRIYNYVLSPAQVKKVMNEGAALRFGR